MVFPRVLRISKKPQLWSIWSSTPAVTELDPGMALARLVPNAYLVHVELLRGCARL